MKKSRKAAVCGIVAALSTVLMLISYFPYLTYAVPAFAGALSAVLLIEYGVGSAFLSYGVSALLTAVLAEPESKILYILFFGYYPILKGLLEKHTPKAVAFLLKFLSFNAAILLSYYLMISVLGLPLPDYGELTGKFKWLLLAVGNVTFFIYDIALSRAAVLYFCRLRPKISKYL